MTSEQFGTKVPPAAVYLSFFFLCPLMVKKKKKKKVSGTEAGLFIVAHILL